MKLFIVFFLLLLGFSSTFSQTKILVTSSEFVLTAKQKEIVYFRFAQGDKLIFSVNGTSKKPLKSFQLVHYPSEILFSRVKTNVVEKQTWTVARDGVFAFEMEKGKNKNTVRLMVERVPASEKTANFSTMVHWDYSNKDAHLPKGSVVRYDTTFYSSPKKVLTKTDTIYSVLYDKTMKVFSKLKLGKETKSYATLRFPENETHRINDTTEITIQSDVWSYWLGVGDHSVKEYNTINKSISLGLQVVGLLSGYEALTSLAATGVSLINFQKSSNYVHYRVYTKIGEKLVDVDTGGDVTMVSGRLPHLQQNWATFEFTNDNLLTTLDVNLKVVLLQLQKTYKTRKITTFSVEPVYKK